MKLLTMWDMPFCYNSLMRLISATHALVRADENNDADSLFVGVENDLQHTTRTVDNALLGQEHHENLVSTDSFDPLLCRLGLEQLSYEMACKSLCAEIAHETTISILNNVSSYSSSEANAALALEAFPLNYKYFLAPAQFHSSRQDVESVEIPKHVPTTFKHLHLQKYEEKISEVNEMINDVLDFSEYVIELKKLSTANYIEDGTRSDIAGLISSCVYWIIIIVVACTTQICCLTSEKDKTRDLSHLAIRPSSLIYRMHREKMEAQRILKEFLQTPDEIVDAYKGLIFSNDDKQSLFDGSTKEMVSVDVLKEKNVLLFISSLNISSDDIWTLIPIYIRRRKKYKFEIVWIPIVEQWTNDLRMQFEMLRSYMPWYILQYFLPVVGIKFIKEEWHFDNKPIVVDLNSQGDVKDKAALDSIREYGLWALASTKPTFRGGGAFCNARGPHENEVYTFYYGGKDAKWIRQFYEKCDAVAEDPLIAEAGHIFIQLHFVRKDSKQRYIPEFIQELLRPFKKERRWAVFMNDFNEEISKDWAIIVTFLERFEQWKGNVRKRRGIETCFKDLLQTGSLASTSTSMNV